MKRESLKDRETHQRKTSKVEVLIDNSAKMNPAISSSNSEDSSSLPQLSRNAELSLGEILPPLEASIEKPLAFDYEENKQS